MKGYQFAILRFRLDFVAAEFVNVGLLGWVPEERRLVLKLSYLYGRLSRFYNDFDGTAFVHLARGLNKKFQTVVEALRSGDGLFEKQPHDVSDILEALVPPGPGCFTWSPVMAGLAENPEVRFEALFNEFVSRHQPHGEVVRRDERMIWQGIDDELAKANLSPHIRPWLVTGPRYKYEFKCAWENGEPQVLEPISLDYSESERILNKANVWTGRLYNLGDARFAMTAVVARPRESGLGNAYTNARAILLDHPHIRNVIEEREVPDFAQDIWRDIREHKNGKAGPPP